MTDPIERPARPFKIPEHGVEKHELGNLLTQLRGEPSYEREGRAGLTLDRSDGLTIVLMAMKAGAELQPHTTPAPAAIVVESGRLAFARADSGEAPLEVAGRESAVFAADVAHSVRAMEDSEFLIIIGGPKKG